MTFPEASCGTTGIAFLKGHGTQNDFVILPDPTAALDLTPERVTALCDRRRGLGADGVLRVATTGALVDAGVLPGVPDGVARDDWFMDYRNADGSIAEMCGNGVRVFAHVVRASGEIDADTFTVGTRAGARPVTVHSVDATDAEVTVEMGPVGVLGVSSAETGGRTVDGVGVDVGNPHLACVVPGLDPSGLDAFALTAPRFDSGMFPHGVNLEILTPPTPDDAGVAVHMRVFERGVGETRSCGTGTVAAAVAALRSAGRETGSVTVRVPGGGVRVEVRDDGATLRGPSVLVARGSLDERWWRTPA